jgi:hypothetical protein
MSLKKPLRILISLERLCGLREYLFAYYHIIPKLSTSKKLNCIWMNMDDKEDWLRRINIIWSTRAFSIRVFGC